MRPWIGRMRKMSQTRQTRQLEFFRSTELDPKTARAICSDFFNSTVIGDLIKWRLLTSVLLPEWETLSTQWKDLLAAGVMERELSWGGEGIRRVDWMARVTPL